MNNEPVYRRHFRGQLSHPMEISRLSDCESRARQLIAEGHLMTAALYYYGSQLFLYYEAIGQPLPPEDFMAPLHPLLSPWPQKEERRDWAEMYHIYWHCAPRDAADWRRDPVPLRRRGRIAYLKHDTMFEYVYHHFAIVREGLLKGDKYMSIALHEDVLFSYFEEPRSSVNILRREGESQAIKEWMDVDPDSHFIHLPGSEGQNFLLLPDYFALGQED
ncbi:MAG: hypothetical protein IJ157_03895 [Clostridia bacterium]|nr:hypothetical protein [Clostridia bacterium]